MPRKAVYILVTKAGPSREDQLAFIRKAVRLDARDEIYVDDVSDRRRTRGAEFPERTALLNQLRPGDVAIVATPGRLGIGRDDIRTVLHTLHRKKTPLIDASTGRSLVWTDEMADALHFFDRAMMEHKTDAAKAARGALANMGIHFVSGPKELLVPEDEARGMWLDEIRYPSGTEVAKLCGVSTRTMYNRFGKRRLEPTPKKLTPSLRVPDGRNYVYVLSRRDGQHKVGFSVDPLRRKRTLESGLSQPLRLVHFVLRPGDARAVEYLTHSHLRKYARGGEWFETDLEGVLDAVETAIQQRGIEDARARQRVIVEAAEKEAGRTLSRAEVTALMRSMEVKDEAEIG